MHTRVWNLNTVEEVDAFCAHLQRLKEIAPASLHMVAAVTFERKVSFRRRIDSCVDEYATALGLGQTVTVTGIAPAPVVGVITSVDDGSGHVRRLKPRFKTPRHR